MKNHNSPKQNKFATGQAKLKISIPVLLFAICCLLFANLSSAQTQPQFMISWKAYNYAPSWYQGKNFLIYSTPVEIAFELLENDKIVNLSNYEIRWYINNSLFIKGQGIQTILFSPKNQAGNNIEVWISIVNYNSINGTCTSCGGKDLNKIIYIPVKNPEVIIDSPYLTGTVKIGGAYKIKALPFFFNVNSLKNLSFDWLVNNQTVFSGDGQSPDVLNLNVSTSTPSGLQIDVNVAVSNVLDTIESAAKKLKLTAK